MMWDSGMGMGWWMFMGGVWFLLFCAIIIWAVAKVTARPESPGPPPALEVARRRYAEGELSREEFEQMRQDLSR